MTPKEIPFLNVPVGLWTCNRAVASLPQEGAVTVQVLLQICYRDKWAGGWGLQTLSFSDPLANLLSFGHAESQISTSVDVDGSKTRLTCTLNGSDAEITGHRWKKGDIVLKEDELSSRTTQYECVRPMEAPRPRVPLVLAEEGWGLFPGSWSYPGLPVACVL